MTSPLDSPRPCSRRALAAAAGTGLILLAGCDRHHDTLVGSDLGKTPAPDFTLTDQNGATVRLSDQRGKAVVLCFIYTSCPDICPIIAASLHAAYLKLKPAVQAKVAFLAVTVDPLRDTPLALRQFTAEHDFTGVSAWHALYADEATLTPIWLAYGIDPGVIQQEMDQQTQGGTAPRTLSHTDALYVIDPEGRERVLLRSDFLPADMARNLTSLAS
jgi:protein SCO1/2